MPKAATPSPSASAAAPGAALKLFAVLMGAFLGLSLLKFGNPPIMEKYVTAPGDIYEFLLGQPWPIFWAYVLLFGVVCAGYFAFRSGWMPLRTPCRIPHAWVLILPALWLGWHILAGMDSVDPLLSRPTVRHLGACVACFYLGYFALSAAQPARLMGLFWIGILAAMTLVIIVGWEQHFGGLEASKRYFFLYVYPTLNQPPPPEYLKKLSSTRIFSTLFYPNTLAGALLLLFPPALGFIWQLTRERFTRDARIFLVCLIGLAGLACLYWSGSKGGWLLMVFGGLICFWRTPLPLKIRALVAAAALVVGLAGFAWKYADFFQRGASSVVARFDYWRAASQIALENPVLGTGPGTFARPYERMKHPDSEMTRMVHNDYLEQASGSGFPAAVLYIGFIVGALVIAFMNVRRMNDWVAFLIWAGLLLWFLQGLFEFGLYVPGVAWPAFTLLGFLVAQRLFDAVPAVRRNAVDTASART